MSLFAQYKNKPSHALCINCYVQEHKSVTVQKKSVAVAQCLDTYYTLDH